MIVTMLSYVGAWAEMRSTELLTADEVATFNASVDNKVDKTISKAQVEALNIKAGDVLSFCVKNPLDGGANWYGVQFQYKNSGWNWQNIVSYDSDAGAISTVGDDFVEYSYTLIDSDIENIKSSPDDGCFHINISANSLGFVLKSVTLKQEYTPVATITVSGPTAVAVGGDITLSTDIYPTNATVKTVTWESSNNEIAIVDADGNVHGVASGDVTITAKATDGSEVTSAPYTVHVVKAIPATINVPSSVRYGETKNISVIVDDMTPVDDYTVSYDTDINTYLTATGGILTPAAVGGPTKVTVTITPSDSKESEGYVTSTFDYYVTVEKGQYTFSAAANPAFFIVEEGGTSTLSYSNVQLNGVDDTTGAFEVTYSPKEGKDGVSISGNKITIAPTATEGTFTAVATLTPTNPTNYNGSTTEVDITIGTPAFYLDLEPSYSVGKSAAAKDLTSFIKFTDYDYQNDATWVFDDPIVENAEVATVAWTQKDNNYGHKLTITPHIVGSTSVSVTVHATKNGKESVAKKTFVVNVTGDPISAEVTGTITVNEDQALTLEVIKSHVSVTANSESITSGYEIEVYDKNSQKVETSIPAVNDDDVDSYNITIKVIATDPNYSGSVEIPAIVTVTHLQSFELTLNADKISIMDNGQQAVITPSATYNSTTPVGISTYDVDYTLSAPNVATVVTNGDNTITVTGQNAGTVTVTVTAHPTDGSTYATATNTTTITVTESQKVYLTTETGADGKSYVVVNVPEGGAFGGISDTPKIDVTNSTVDLTALKNAANVKVKGNIANSDVQELVNLIGGRWTDKSDLHCETLDMGEARMTEAITYKASTFVCSLLPHFTDGDNTKSLVTVENLTLPLPCPTATVLPKGMKMLTSDFNTYSSNSLQSLVIPEGWTEVADEAWADAQSDPALGGDKCGLEHLTSLKLADSIKRIGAFAFSNSHVEKLFMPKNIEYIGAGAFNWSPKLSDIYFTGSGEKLKYVDQDAFSVQTQMVNDCIESDNICNNKNMPTMDRSHYVNGGVLACILHYPHGCDAEYTDVTRTYRVVDTYGDNLYIKGNIDPNHGAYTPENWTFDFINNVNAASKNQDVKLIQDTTKPALSGGFPDVTYGYSMIWPSQYQMTTGYAIANAGYLWSGEHMSNAQLDLENGIDKRGLYQFIVALDNAPTDQEEWPFKYQQDLWYTISLPFSMTPAEIRKVFGDKTQVCRFSKVIRDVTDEDAKVLRLEFRYSVMEENDGRPRKITYTDIVEKKTDGTVVTEDIEKAGILHHHAYMIKPSGTVDSDPSIKFNSVTGERVYKGYKSEPGIIQEEKLTAVLKDPETPVPGKDYYFRPNLMETTIKKNSYVLVNKNDKHQYAFYKGVKDGSVYKDGGRALANTAYVQLDHGQADFNDYFPVSTGSASVKFSSHFGDFFDDEEDITKIDKIEIVCGDEEPANDKIYTISGVLVSGKSLAPGLYIKNGKKYFVK